MDDKMKQMSLVILSVFYTLTVASASIPALLWGAQELDELKQYPAGHTVSTEDFTNILQKLKKKSPQDLLVFLQNKLSLDDITHHAGVYGNSDSVLNNLKDLMEKQTSTHYPRVAAPADSVQELRKMFPGSVHDLKAPYAVSDLPLSDAASNLIVVHLPDASSTKDVGASLHKTDDIIGSVSSDMSLRKKPYTALYTGVASSKVKRQPVYLGRHLLAATEEHDHFYNGSGCIFFYAEKMTINVKGVAMNTTVFPEAEKSNATCENQTKLDLVFKVEGFTELNMSLEFNMSLDRYWSLSSWTLTYDLTSQNNVTTVSIPSADIYGPATFSYHCQDPALTTKNAVLTITNFQLQAFDIVDNVFGRPNDCVGFFTIPIWTGIVSSLVLIAILTFGIALLANINTMDRFDDPKGKTISVNVGE